MKIIALSGGIASGKNEVAKIFNDLGVEVFDADLEVHKLYQFDQEVIDKVKKIFPNSYQQNIINRKILGELINQDVYKLKDLELIIHPMIREKYQQFITKNINLNQQFVVINIPLLLEQNFYRYDYLVAIIANQEIRKQRFINRYQLNNSNQQINIEDLINKFNHFKNIQIDDQSRISKANFIIENNFDLDHLKNQVVKIYQQIL